MSAITDLIDQVAASLGLDPRLAEAIAYHESGFNPLAIGDAGHSRGLYQLNDRGEGAGWSPADLFNPTLNARRALGEVAAVSRAHPGADPGWIAAAAQRPADPAGYASTIDQLLAGGIPGSAQFVSSGPPAGDPRRRTPPQPGFNPLAPVGDIAGAITGIPAGIGHGLAGALGAATHDVGVFLQRQFIALAVAAVVLLVLFR